MYVAPTLNKLGIVPAQDAFCRKGACGLVCVFMLIAAAVRPFHMADPHTWGWVMLGIEIVFSLIGLLSTVQILLPFRPARRPRRQSRQARRIEPPTWDPSVPGPPGPSPFGPLRPL